MSAAPDSPAADRCTRAPGGLRALLLAGLLYGVTTVALTWPLALGPRSMLAGHPGNDTWNHVWGFWWIGQEVLVRHRWPGWTDLIAWPDGGALYFIDTFNGLVTLPLQAIAGPVATHNAVFAGSIWFSALAAWALARHVARDAAAALVAGVTFGFCPHILAQAHNGISESLNIGWLALYTLALLRLLEEPRLARGLLAWGALGACGVFNWYYGLFAGFITVVVVICRAWRQPLPWGRIGRAAVFGAVFVGPLLAAALWALKGSMDAPDALVDRDPEFVWRSLLYHNMTDLQCLFRPGRFYSPDLRALYGEDLLIVVYIGWAAIALAGVALLRVRPWRRLAPWLTVALVFGIFSLGPYLYVFGDYPQVAGRRVPLPFLAFFEALPLFSRISHPFRFVVGVELGVALLAALGLASWLRGRRRLVAWPAGILAAGLVLAETWCCSPAVLPVAHAHARLPEGYQAIIEDPEPGAVLDLPIAFPLLERAVYNWYQVHHGRPIPYTLNEPLPPGLRHNQLARFLLDLEASRARLLPRTLPDLELVVSARVLARQRYRWVVVHDRLYPELKRQQVTALLNALLGPPTHEDGELTIYRVP